jgi:hypothetical protein
MLSKIVLVGQFQRELSERSAQKIILVGKKLEQGFWS